MDAAVPAGDGHTFATGFVVTSVQSYEPRFVAVRRSFLPIALRMDAK